MVRCLLLLQLSQTSSPQKKSLRECIRAKNAMMASSVAERFIRKFHENTSKNNKEKEKVMNALKKS
jgi:hypothetical protein